MTTTRLQALRLAAAYGAPPEREAARRALLEAGEDPPAVWAPGPVGRLLVAVAVVSCAALAALSLLP